MMRSFRMCAVIFLVSGAMLTTACGKKKVETPAPAPAPPPPPPPTAPPAPPAPAPPPAAPAPAAPTEDELFAKMSLDELNAKGVLADVFFALRLNRARIGRTQRASEEHRLPEAAARARR